MDQYSQICLEAVKRNGLSLRYVKEGLVKDRYVDICLEAVKRNGRVMHFVDPVLVGDRYAEILAIGKENGVELVNRRRRTYRKVAKVAKTNRT